MSSSEFGCLAAFLLFLFVGLAVWQLVETIRRSSRMNLLERMLRYTQGHLEQAQADIEKLKKQLARPETSAEPSAVAHPAAAQPPAAQPPAAQPVPRPEPAPQPGPPRPEPQPVPLQPLPPRSASPSPQPLRPPAVPPAATAASPMPAPVALPPAVAPAPRPAPVRLAPLPPSPALPPVEPATPFDWESLIGVKLFSWIAGIFLFIAAILFVIYGVKHGWITPPVQMSLVVALGLGLLVASEIDRVRQFEVTAQAMAAAGIAILFVAFFAANSGWKLIPGPVAFLFMALTAAVAVLLSIRRDSIFIALLGLLGGFATPVLLSTGVDHAVGLFSYLLLLNVGLNLVAYRRNWPVLKGLSLAFTALYQLGWVVKFLEQGKLGLALGIFLLFPVVTFGSLLLARSRDEEPDVFSRMSSLAGLPPLLFALFMASVPAYGQNTGMLFAFTAVVAAGLAAMALFRGPEWLHLLGAVSTLLVWAVWFSSSYSHAAWPTLLAFLGLFLGIYLGVPRLQARLSIKRPFTQGGQYAVYAAPLLLFAFPVLASIEPAVKAPGLLFGVLALFMAFLADHAIRFEEGIVHFLACFFVLLAEALWSGRHLAPDNLIPALMIYGGFGLFYLGVPVYAQARGRELKPQGSGAILAFASLLLLFFLAAGPMARISLWALALMVGILSLGLLYEASRGHRPVLCFVGLLTGWILLAVWWVSAPLKDLLVPALAVLGAFALLVVGGSLWLRRKDPGDAVAGPGVFLGLVGHLFLLAVVTQPHLAVPPWPWLAVLAVLDLALGVGALYARQGAALVGAGAMTQFLLMVWALNGRTLRSGALAVPEWVSLVPLCSLAFAALAYAWFEIGRRKAPDLEGFPLGAGVSLALGLVLMAVLNAFTLTHTPGALALILSAYLAGLLAVAWRSPGGHGWALAGSLLVWIPVLTSLTHVGTMPAGFTWSSVLVLATPPYLMLLAYPLLLGRRGEDATLPYTASIVASVAYFFFARQALVALGYASVIGALPIAQALLLGPHLLLLLRLQPVGMRNLGRLAAVTGAILAFITVAIPLQLDKEWITLGWALLGAALAWLYTRVPHKGLLAWCAGLMAVVLVRLTLNPALWAYHPRSPVPFLNWFLYTYLLASACCFAAARILKDRDDRFAEALPRLSALLSIEGAVLIFWLVNIQIADLFSTGPALTFNFTGGGLAQQLAYTFGWALYAIGLLIVGLVRHHRATRVTAIVILSLTIAKAFLLDLSHLEGLYRVASFAGLAVCLGAVAVMLQKFVLKKGEQA